jgi:hypothetical protein
MKIIVAMKVINSSENINSFGGINFADSILANASVYKTIDQFLGSRGTKATYSYSDLIRSYQMMGFCGGSCAEDINEHLRSELSHLKGFNVCSADTLLRMQKELATEKETFTAPSGVKHEFNINLKMNRLMVKLLVQTGQLAAKTSGYILGSAGKPQTHENPTKRHQVRDGRK